MWTSTVRGFVYFARSGQLKLYFSNYMTEVLETTFVYWHLPPKYRIDDSQPELVHICEA